MKQPFHVIFCYWSNKLACFCPRLSCKIGFWWARYSSCVLSTHFLTLPWPFLFSWSEQKDELAGATVLSLSDRWKGFSVSVNSPSLKWCGHSLGQQNRFLLSCAVDTKAWVMDVEKKLSIVNYMKMLLGFQTDFNFWIWGMLAGDKEEFYLNCGFICVFIWF